MEHSVIDPRLRGDPSQTQPQTQPQPRVDSLTLPTRNLDDLDLDGRGNEGGEKRRKLNLLKCRHCRDARKKCFPVDRVWPQKCDRCRQHKPNELECSEPELNTRTRGPNLSKDPKDPKPLRRSKTQSTSDKQESREADSEDDSDHPSSDDASTFERPVRNMVFKGIKREHPGSPVSETPLPPSITSAYLPLKNGEFRILQLASGGRKEEKVVCSLVTASMDRPMKYEAISYLWGNAGPRQTYMAIDLVDPQGRHHSIHIKSNLYAALRSLRHPKNPRLFWVDALCINYNNGDSQEKNQQITMKQYVFHNAANLCFWLGEDPIYKVALDFIPRIQDLAGIGKLVRDDTVIDEWVAFVTLLKNPVFSRLWFVQEVAVARNVTLHCGQPAIHYGDLVDAVAMFMSFRAEISLLFRRNGKDYKELTDRKMTMVERFIDISTNAVRKSSGQLQRLLSLESLVSQLSDLSATAPLDRIYSVLAIAKDGPPLKTWTQYPHESPNDGLLQIDYHKSVLEVYQDFVFHVIKSSQSLNIICRYWESSAEANLPTWVRPLQSSLQLPFNSKISERTNADSLVGMPDRAYYHASRGTTATLPIKCDYTLNNNSKSLFVPGLQLDKISKLGARAPEGIILYEWLELSGCVTAGETVAENISETVAENIEDFWRTLVADRGPNGCNPPSWYARAFYYCLHNLTPTRDINTNRLIDECEGESSLIVDFLQRVQSVIWNRKFLVTEKKGWIGLAPMASRIGDVVCILYDCSVPVVLRPDADGGKWWQLVGECYVHGMMDGEAIAGSEGRGEEFEIR